MQVVWIDRCQLVGSTVSSKSRSSSGIRFTYCTFGELCELGQQLVRINVVAVALLGRDR